MLLKCLRLIVRTFFREIVIDGQDNLPPSGPVILTPNHPNSLLDPLILLTLPRRYRIRFVAKAALFKIPQLGWLMRRIGAIPVVRRMDTEGNVDYETFFASCVATLAAGESIVIFPEGRSLPQPYMTSLRTGTARLFFLAYEKGVSVKIVPVGLNYERGSIFRTHVVVSVAPPIDTSTFAEKHKRDPKEAVRELTDEIARALHEHVFQTDNFRDRDLMLLLDRLYRTENTGDSWPERLRRLKMFETGFKTLRDAYSQDIEQLRYMLSQYEMQSLTFEKKHGIEDTGKRLSFVRFLMACIGLPVAVLGALLNLIPYKLCHLLVTKIKRHHEAATATYKVTYSLFLFPLSFLGEGLLIHWWLGGAVSIPFAIGIIPLSYFTLFYFEWLTDGGWGVSVPLERIEKIQSDLIASRLHHLRRRIQDLVDALAGRLDAGIGD
jgi:glycerol-3-phosphate O-acyltransferase/dihydroxyacetone phosphate acyltransferase